MAEYLRLLSNSRAAAISDRENRKSDAAWITFVSHRPTARP